jgi:hypothetical protein
MEPQATPALESVYAFLRTDEWKILINVFQHYYRTNNKRNIRTAAPFWTRKRKAEASQTHMAWEYIIAELDGIRQAMWDLPGLINRPSNHTHYMIRLECHRICQNIVRIVNNYATMALTEAFTTYMRQQQYDIVKMKYFRAHPTQIWRGWYVKCGKLFGGVQDIPLLSFLHRVHDVFLIPEDPEVYEDRYPHRCTWPDTAAVPDKFIYWVRTHIPARQIINPDGISVAAIPVPRDDICPEKPVEEDSSASDDDRKADSDSGDSVVRGSMRTVRIGHDSDDDDGVVAGSRRDVSLNRPSVHPEPESDHDDGGVAGSRHDVYESDGDDVRYPDLNAGFWGGHDSDTSEARLTTMLHDLNQLSLS